MLKKKDLIDKVKSEEFGIEFVPLAEVNYYMKPLIEKFSEEYDISWKKSEGKAKIFWNRKNMDEYYKAVFNNTKTDFYDELISFTIKRD